MTRLEKRQQKSSTIPSSLPTCGSRPDAAHPPGRFTELADRVTSGELPLELSRYAFDDVCPAHADMSARVTVGEVVLEATDEAANHPDGRAPQWAADSATTGLEQRIPTTT